MYFKAIVTDGDVRIQVTRNIKDAMMAVTMICHDINGIKEYSESDRAVFREFVKEELAKLAFVDVDGLIEEKERLKELCESAKPDKKSLKEILKELSDLWDEDDDE